MKRQILVLRSKITSLWQTITNNPIALFLLLLILVAAVWHPLWQLVEHQRYQLSREAAEIVGPVNDTLAEKMELNHETLAFEFNAQAKQADMPTDSDDHEAVAAALTQKQQTGGGGEEDENLYALDLPIDPKEGATFHDTNTQTSFTMTPQFSMGNARKEAGHIVYPINEGGQAVYSTKANGVKEDIILYKPRGNDLTFSYTLDLPETLEAKIIEESGELGIFSADPVLFGNISFGGDDDQEKVMNARKTAPKNHLVFVLPAPVIIQNEQTPHEAKAKFVLDGSTLHVEASGLEQLNYPISIDPSVIITSSSDFRLGNNDSNISYGTDLIQRSPLKSGVLEPWANSTNQTTTRAFMGAVAYNGFVYTAGGFNSSFGGLNSVEYAPINSNGTLGTWQTTTALPSGRWYHSMATYNGYLYAVGGNSGSGTIGTVVYAPINANGTVGAWQSTSTMLNLRENFGIATYEGRMYVFGGWNGTIRIPTVEYASFNANGTLTAWQTTTAMTAGRNYHVSVAYNGYVYVLGGILESGTLSQVEYAPINNDGTIGTWVGTTVYTNSRFGPRAVAADGYMYILGGIMGSTYLNDVQYASINADGSLGTWRATSSMVNIRAHGGTAFYDGRVYMIGGTAGSAGADITNTTEFAAMRPPGYTSPYIAGTSFTTARDGAAAVVYNNFIYILGGRTATTPTFTNTVRYAPLNANGTVGTWATATNLPSAREGHTAVTHNGFMYLLGGRTAASTFVNTSHYAPINADGSLGAWTASTSFTTARYKHASVTYEGYVYVIGGQSSTTAFIDTVRYAPINSDGTLGTWGTVAALPAVSSGHGAVIAHGRIYVVGGQGAASTYYDTVRYATLTNNGLLSAWTTSPSTFPTARTNAGVVFTNGYLYIIGGTNGTQQSLVHYAPVNADATVGTWTANQSYIAAREGMSVATANGYIYGLGGLSGTTFQATIHFAQINNGGPGTTGTWSTTSALATPRSLHAVVTHNNFVYAIGGYDNVNGFVLGSVEYAPINRNGTLGSWSTTSTLSAARLGVAATIHNGYVYALGGYDNTFTPQTTVQFAPINSNGTLGTWSTTTPLVGPRGAGGAASYNNYLYYLFGFDGTTESAFVYYAPINSNGTVGSWTSTSGIVGGRTYPGVFVYRDYVYTVGGAIGNNPVARTHVSRFNTDGSLTAWQTSATLPAARYGHAIGAANGYVYVAGGTTTATTNSVLVGQISSGGRLENWQTTTTMPAARSGAGGAIHNGYFYSVGGYDGGSQATTTTYLTSLNSIARVGYYTRLVDLGIASKIQGITFNGTAHASRSLRYRLAGDDGVFGSLQNPADINTPYQTARYVFLQIEINDSRAGVFDDVTIGQVTDATVTYQPNVPPELRMRHGKMFYEGILQPYETDQ